MKIRTTGDVGFFKKGVENFNRNKSNFIKETHSNYNYNNFRNFFYTKADEYRLGNKFSHFYLTTDKHSKKGAFLDVNAFFEHKYSNIYPKSAILGVPHTEDFAAKGKDIGDISFEEDNNEKEAVKNLTRLTPDFLSEEWIKDNLTTKVVKLNIENHHWLSLDLISKLTRLDGKLEVVK